MEKSFKSEIELLRLGDGQVFHGEGIVRYRFRGAPGDALTKAAAGLN